MTGITRSTSRTVRLDPDDRPRLFTNLARGLGWLLHLGTLIGAASTRSRTGRRAAIATAAVVGVTALDTLCAARLTARRPARESGWSEH
jgi:hypothetical protein